RRELVGRSGTDRRAPRSERRREDDRDRADGGDPSAEHGVCADLRGRSARPIGACAARRHVARLRDHRLPVGARGRRPLQELLPTGHDRQRCLGACRPGPAGRAPRRRPVARQQAASLLRAGDRVGSRAAVPRRADRGHGRRIAPGAARLCPRSPRRGTDGPPHDARSRGGGSARRPGGRRAFARGRLCGDDPRGWSMNAFGAQTVMEVRRIARNTRFLIFTLLTPLVYYIFFVLAFGDRTSTQGISGKAFFLVSMAAFGVIGTALVSFAGRIAAERQRGWFRLLRTTPLPTSAIFGAKLVAAVLASIEIGRAH